MLAVSRFLAMLSTLNVPEIMGPKGSCAGRILPNYISFEIRYIETDGLRGLKRPTSVRK